METIAIIVFVVTTFGPIVAYSIYTALRGEPRRPDKPRKKSGVTPADASGGASA
jgi:hypothetical protein